MKIIHAFVIASFLCFSSARAMPPFEVDVFAGTCTCVYQNTTRTATCVPVSNDGWDTLGLVTVATLIATTAAPISSFIWQKTCTFVLFAQDFWHRHNRIIPEIFPLTPVARAFHIPRPSFHENIQFLEDFFSSWEHNRLRSSQHSYHIGYHFYKRNDTSTFHVNIRQFFDTVTINNVKDDIRFEVIDVDGQVNVNEDPTMLVLRQQLSSNVSRQDLCQQAQDLIDRMNLFFSYPPRRTSFKNGINKILMLSLENTSFVRSYATTNHLQILFLGDFSTRTPSLLVELQLL